MQELLWHNRCCFHSNRAARWTVVSKANKFIASERAIKLSDITALNTLLAQCCFVIFKYSTRQVQAVKEDVNFHEGQHQSQSGKLHFQNFWICVKFTPAVKEKVYSSERAVKPWEFMSSVKLKQDATSKFYACLCAQIYKLYHSNFLSLPLGFRKRYLANIYEVKCK